MFKNSLKKVFRKGNMDCIFYFVIFKCELILTFFKISLFLAIGEF